MPTAIEFNHISKQYRLGLVSTRTLSHDLNRWWTMNILRKEDPYLKIGETNDRSTKGNSEYVWALRDIDFKIEQGDVVGIIGKNGAGKSTLLKLLSRVTAPTTGTIRAKGRIASLLEVGTGFHPEMTGRENIFMNGAIMGMTKQEIRAKLDEIVDFSGCERYLDTLVKRYSSGMMVRLGFAVAAHLDPEILVVDEVLAVGDAEFQKKAIGKMQDVAKGEGRTVLFVSHNMTAVKNLCKSGVILKNGIVDYMGEIGVCIDRYMENNLTEYITTAVIADKQHRSRFSVVKDLEYVEARLLNESFSLATDEPIEVMLKIKRNNKSIKQFQAGMLITDEQDERVGSFTGPLLEIPQDRDSFEIKIFLCSHNLAPGSYKLDFNIGLKDFTIGAKDYDIVLNVLSFQIKYIDSKTKSEYLFWSKGWGKNAFCDGKVELCL